MSETASPVPSRQVILVVDDDPETARLLRSWYAGQPFDILEASDGEEGVRVALREGPDLILLDLRMPRLDGLGAARRLRAEAETRTTPLVFLTAVRDVAAKREAFTAGVDDYIEKPFVLEEIDVRLRVVLRRREIVRVLESSVKDLKVTNQQLEELLAVDEKTGLANFRGFQRRLGEEWLRAERYGTSLSLVMLDIDDFKRINDTHGHPAGDRVLQEFATLVVGGARATDLAARFGGEEFAIVLPHTGGPMAVRVAERIRLAVREFPFLDPSPIRITVSAGVATYPSIRDIRSAEALVEAADRALYRAKQTGKDRVVYEESAAGPPGRS